MDLLASFKKIGDVKKRRLIIELAAMLAERPVANTFDSR